MQTDIQASYNTYLTIFKIRGDAIYLKHHDEKNRSLNNTHSFRIVCQEMDNRTTGSDVKVFVLNDSITPSDKCIFQYQKSTGQALNNDDLLLFMAPPMSASSKASYSLNILATKHNSSMEDLSETSYVKIGSAYMYMDPKFSTQGVQRMSIIGTHSLAPIGHMQVEYLIIKNPAAYGAHVPRPSWLSRMAQLDAGHRGSGSGCRADLPGPVAENTVASFNYAARHGADMCELDVMCTLDGVPVIYHNYMLGSNELGATQIDQLTLKELRSIKNPILHDKNCHHEPGSDQERMRAERSSHPFPTLEEVLKEVDQTCALNIELKWPQLLPNGKSEATQYREINDFVDRVMSCIYEHSNGRAILLSTFNADIAIMLRMKQAQYPVLFLTTGDKERFNDPITKTIKNAIHFAQAFDMAGINPNVATLTEYLVRYAQDRGLLVYAWGKIESTQAIRELKRIGANGVIYDKIDLIKPQD